MKSFAICFLLLTVVSCATLFAMKYILWAMFKWGGGKALILAMAFIAIYVGSFMAVTRNWTGYQQYVTHNTLKWIWVLGIVQLAVLGTLYHLLPQFFPAIIADFFFA